MLTSLPYFWAYDIDEAHFNARLCGELTFRCLNQVWASIRLLEYSPYSDIIRMLGFSAFVKGWLRWRNRIRSETRKRGFDFLVDWLHEYHPELIESPFKA